ncbi:MAG: hypothetical protein LUI87_11570 [Lachnospiraceae bacterium]|nr:hypothetical protein [Lachnospiraceae bacterium]
MAEKELRRMNRTELIEIIYALQQNGMTLQQENEELRRQLEEKTIRMEKAGSIAEAALSLNHIFEDAEAAAQQYLDSVRAACGSMEPLTEKTPDLQTESLSASQQKRIRHQEETSQESNQHQEEAQQESNQHQEEAQQECGQLLKETQQECDQLRQKTRQECDQLLQKTRQECDQMLKETRQECDRMQAQALQQARNKIDTVNRELHLLLGKYPILEEYMKKEFGKEAEGSAEAK